MTELLGCPFCGGEPERLELTDEDNFGGSVISCKKCGASSPVHFDRKENLDDSWNRRPSTADRGWEVEPSAAKVKAASLSETLNFYISDSEEGISRVPRLKLVEIQDAMRVLEKAAAALTKDTQP